jgi:hypothetical protein
LKPTPRATQGEKVYNGAQNTGGACSGIANSRGTYHLSEPNNGSGGNKDRLLAEKKAIGRKQRTGKVREKGKEVWVGVSEQDVIIEDPNG